MDSVCYKCASRTSTCHEDCEVYAEWAEENAKRREKERLASAFTEHRGAQITRNIKYVKDVKGKVRRS